MLNQFLATAMIMLMTVGAMVVGAGVYKFAASEPSPVLDAPNLSRTLIDGLLSRYVEGPSNPVRQCLREFSSSINNFVDDESRTVDVRFNADSRRWAVRAVCGDRVETWEVDDMTHEIRFLTTPTPAPTPTSAPTLTPALTVTFDAAPISAVTPTIEVTPTAVPTVTPAPNLNRSTIDNLLSGYLEDILPGFDCLSEAGLGVQMKGDIDVNYSDGEWTVTSSGPGCRGAKHTWTIDDVTGEMKYLGPS